MRKWLKNKLREWAGVEEVIAPLNTDIDTLRRKMKELERLHTDLVSIGVDVHFKEPHMILIYSKLNGGQIREISANFETVQELNNFVIELRERFKTSKVTFDVPSGFYKDFLIK